MFMLSLPSEPSAKAPSSVGSHVTTMQLYAVLIIRIIQICVANVLQHQHLRL